MLLAGAHQNSKTVAMLSSMAAAEEGSPQGNIVTGGGEFSLQSIVRPNIWKLEAYHCARDDYTEGVLLDANENPFGPPVSPNDLVYERYPCPYQQIRAQRPPLLSIRLASEDLVLIISNDMIQHLQRICIRTV